MQLRKAERKQAKIKMGLQGPSGSGKTSSSLLIAFGLTGTWESIAVIDTEFSSADLYAHLGAYNVLNLSPPYSPERYIKAIEICEQSDIEAIVIDSISHEWDGEGGILSIHGSMAGNSFTNWSKITPRHNAFVNKILQANAHVIATIRSKQDYVMTEKNGKMVPEKVGLKGVQRDGLDYEFTLLMTLSISHHATATKDRTGLFMDKPPVVVSEEVGVMIKNWCHEGISIDKIKERISDCDTVEELVKLYNDYPQFQETLKDHFTYRKQLLEKEPPLANYLKLNPNGINNNQ